MADKSERELLDARLAKVDRRLEALSEAMVYATFGGFLAMIFDLGRYAIEYLRTGDASWYTLADEGFGAPITGWVGVDRIAVYVFEHVSMGFLAMGVGMAITLVLTMIESSVKDTHASLTKQSLDLTLQEMRNRTGKWG